MSYHHPILGSLCRSRTQPVSESPRSARYLHCVLWFSSTSSFITAMFWQRGQQSPISVLHMKFVLENVAQVKNRQTDGRTDEYTKGLICSFFSFLNFIKASGSLWALRFLLHMLTCYRSALKTIAAAAHCGNTKDATKHSLRRLKLASDNQDLAVLTPGPCLIC